jgi:hypothetical protein
MSDLPRPLTPADCDLRGFEWMPLWGHRMFSSSWYRAARKDGRGGIASLKLWWSAMLQHPAGSLPNDEEELCMLADFGEDMRAWRKHRAVAMHGFILCCDNRWYHPMVAEQAVEAYARRLKAAQTRHVDAERLRRWRAAQNGSTPPQKPDGETHPETPDETRFNNRYKPPETRFETPMETGSETSRAFDRTVQDKKEPPVGPRSAGTGATRGDGTNPRAMGTNPRAIGTNPRAKTHRNGFVELERRLAASSPTIDATAEEVADFQAFRRRLTGGSNG